MRGNYLALPGFAFVIALHLICRVMELLIFFKMKYCKNSNDTEIQMLH